MALGALIVLGGGAGGAYLYFMKPAEASLSDEAAAKAEEVKKEKEAKKDAHGKGAAFVELDPLVLPIVDSEGLSQVISLVVALEVPDDKAKAELEGMIPRLKDAFIQDMYGMLSREAALKDGILQVGYIKERLNAVSAEVVGPDKVNGVLLQVVQQRPI